MAIENSIQSRRHSVPAAKIDVRVLPRHGAIPINFFSDCAGREAELTFFFIPPPVSSDD
jgi:hypothetical protein